LATGSNPITVISPLAPIEHPKTPPSASVVTTFSDSGNNHLKNTSSWEQS